MRAHRKPVIARQLLSFLTDFSAISTSKNLIIRTQSRSLRLEFARSSVSRKNSGRDCQSAPLIFTSLSSEFTVMADSVTTAFQENVATGLVHHFPPKHHQRALGIIESVLAKEPKNVPCLLAHAYILRYSRKYAEGKLLFARVAQLVNKEDDHILYLEAQEEVAWCDSLSTNYHDACKGLRRIIEELDPVDENAERKARVWWRLGQTLWNYNRSCTLDCFFRRAVLTRKS